MLLQPKIDKTHWVAISTPNDGRIVLGSLWSKASTGELYICTAIAPVVFTLLTGGSGAPVGSSYVVASADGTLTDERVLTAGANITITDNGPGGTIVIAGAAGGGGGADADAQLLAWLGL